MEFRGVAAPPPAPGAHSALPPAPLPPAHAALAGAYSPGALSGAAGASDAFRGLGPPSLPVPPLGSPLGHPAYGGLYFNATMGKYVSA